MKYQIIHAERDFRYHEKLKTALSSSTNFQFSHHCCYMDAALKLLEAHQPQILLTASKLFDETKVVEEFCNYRNSHQPELKIIVLSSKDSLDHFLGSLEAGVDGYISKNSTTDEIVRCLQTVVYGDHYLCVQKQVINH